MLQLTAMCLLMTVNHVVGALAGKRLNVKASAAVLTALLVTGKRDASDQVSNSYSFLASAPYLRYHIFKAKYCKV